MIHIPVLLKEVIELLNPKEGEVMIDGTFGSGGHAQAILEKLGPEGKFLGIDLDKKNIERFALSDSRFAGIVGNYVKLPEIMAKNNFPKADGLLLDLGFSSEQLEERGRGFSFQKAEPLIMTYSDDIESLHQFLRRTNIQDLTEIISKFGEERYAPRIAKAILENRKRIANTKELAEVIRSAVPKNYERGRIHPATRTFQALRIYLNQELENLSRVLDLLDKILKPGGRVTIISFHSLEDRIVKQKFKFLEKQGRIKILTKKPIRPSAAEVRIHPRSRSAKLRSAIML